MILAHKIQLDPTGKQAHQLSKAAGCSRYTWNWALAEAEKHYKETGKTVNFNELKKRWNREKPEWVYESHRDANSQPFANLKTAYTRFFKKQAKRPQFKSKHRSKDKFYLANDKFRVDGLKVRIPLMGWVKLTEELRFRGKTMSATVSRTADRWFISIQVEVQPQPKHGDDVIGIDLGLKHFMTLSTGEVIDAPKPMKSGLKKLQRLSRQHSRKQKGSKNREKSAARLAQHHARVANIRKDFIHKTTSDLVARAKLLVIEDLSTSGMMKLWGIAVSDIGLYETRRQLQYKCALQDCGLLEADRWYPSSQLCSCCGGRQKLELGERVYRCPDCDYVADRDLNAARNLYTLGLREINARGHEGSDYQHTLAVKPSWMNQELNQYAESVQLRKQVA